MQYAVRRSDVHRHAHELMRACLRLGDFSPLCSARVMLHVLFSARARLCSLACAALSLATAPSREAVREAWLAWIPARDEPLRRLNRCLTDDVPRHLRRQPQRVAMDLTLIPCHGQPMLDPSEVYRSQAKDGTSHFHAYATAHVDYRGQRYTLALTTVDEGEKMEAVIKRLPARLGRLGVASRMLLLDRGPWSVAVIRHLQAARKPLLMPVIVRGRKAGHADGPGGTRVLAPRESGGWGEHRLTAGDKKTARVSIRVHCRNYAGQWGRHGRQTLVYAFWGMKPSSTRRVRETYRKRFAIETSYRQMRQGRARTCTRNPLVRLLLVAAALILRNAWVWLHHAVLSTPRRGGPRLNQELLPLKDLLLWPQHQAETELGLRDEIQTQRPMPPRHNS